MTVPELSRVRLTRTICREDADIPKGTLGTVVHVYPDAKAYEVEFSQPVHAVLLVNPDELELESEFHPSPLLTPTNRFRWKGMQLQQLFIEDPTWTRHWIDVPAVPNDAPDVEGYQKPA